ncbi:MAG: Alpha/beta hydrolase fold-3 domain protein [Deltaproteobacteria bacterium]|nr:Alpha/beta hydrolase fold-3 domain protein [Deltaproteobacteria bacterium]
MRSGSWSVVAGGEIEYRLAVRNRLLRGVTRVALSQPVVGLLGRKRREGVDAALDPQIAAVLEVQRLLRLPTLESMEPARARRFAEHGMAPLDVPTRTMAEVIDTTVGGPDGEIPVRIFVPADAGPHWIVYFHGGGGVIGSIRSSEPVTRLLAHQTGCTVASVEYRLGPEHHHPAAIEDACAAWDALMSRVPPDGRVAVAGDSFGGFLSAHVVRHARRKPDLQVLIYPMVDLTHSLPSIDRHAHGYLLTRSMVQWFRSHYTRPGDDREAASPRFWSLHGSAPAIVATAGYDPLVDEGDDHADRLQRAGVPVRHRRYPSLIHGFLSLAGGVRAARTATDELCADIRELLGTR